MGTGGMSGSKRSKTPMQAKINSDKELGATVWERDDKKRLYFNGATEKIVGLEYGQYKSGNVSGATLNGEPISNTTARQYLEAMKGAYADLNTGEVHVKKLLGRGRVYSDYIEQALSDYLKKKR